VVYQKRGERRDVAEFFGKEALQRPNLDPRDHRKFAEPLNFQESSFRNEQRREMPCFTMGRAGFSRWAALERIEVEPTDRATGVKRPTASFEATSRRGS
jgi:hypothetical protein